MKNPFSTDGQIQWPNFRLGKARTAPFAVLVAIAFALAWWAAPPSPGPQSARAQDSSKSNSPSANKTPAPASSKSDKKAPEEPVATGAPPAIGTLFPVGREFRGVKIPSYSGDILNSVVLAQTMIRVDDEHLEMRDLEITLFGRSSEEKDTVITTDVGVYDLKSETLTSRSKAYINRDGEFTMEGDRMVFNGKTQEGRLIGIKNKVKMRFFKISETFSNP
jgi:hypothetical protein